MSRKIIVVGGGAAGLMAAGRAAELGAEVEIIEKMNRTALKLGITGKGRCNITNDCAPQDFIGNVVHNPRFMMSAIYGFTPSDTMEFFTSRGLPVKVERGNRVFPESDRALDVVAVMRKYASSCRIVNENALSLIVSDGKCVGVKTSRGERYGDAVIIATGGMSYPQTGSTGDGYRLAKECGHSIIPPMPSLVPIEVMESWCFELQGLSLRNCSVTLKNSDGKEVYDDFGELLFTHFGLSGPTILSMSSHMKAGESYTIDISLKPTLDEKTLDSRVLSDLTKYANRNFENSLDDLLPKKLIPVIVKLSGIDPYKKSNSVTRTERERLCFLLHHLTLTFRGFRPIDEAIVTSGGVCTKEIDPKTMRSKLVRGLYFAGEVIDVDAYTGGFNLQIAFCTAKAAAQGAALK